MANDREMTSGGTVVSIVGLGKCYGRTSALRDVTVEIDAGEVFAYLGPNGAGKTTTIRILMGLLKPTTGRAQVFGLNAWRQSVQVHRRVGYVSGEAALYDRMTGREHVQYLAHLRHDRGTQHADDLANRLDLDLGRPARQLSKGNRQKLALVLALMSRPALLILDEPTSGLDPLVQQEFHAVLGEHTLAGGTVLLSSHILGEVERVADRVGVLREGRLVAVERLDQLRRKSLHHICVSFADHVPAADLSAVPGVRDVTVVDGSLHCNAPQAALDQLIKRAAAHDIVDFECAEADLEETFMAYYGSGGDHDAP